MRKKLLGVILAVWLLFISGVFADHVGSPGILQSVRIHRLLDMKKDRLATAEADLEHLRNDQKNLEKNPFVQEREIRRVLGYVASDEMVFDFNQNNPNGLASTEPSKN